MYDFIVSLFETLFKNGLTLSSLGAVVFLLLKQRKVKKRMRHIIPILFQEESDVKEYVQNQEIIKHNLKIMMKGMGLKWHAPISNKSSINTAKRQRRSYSSFSETSTYAHSVEQLNQRRDYNMAKKKVVIDPGHGGKDPGTAGLYQPEKNYVLDLGLRIKQQLEQSYEVEVIMTRSTDVFLELSERTNLANKLNADVLVSVHCNGTAQSDGGFESFRYTKASSETKKLQKALHTQIMNRIKPFGVRDRGQKAENLHMCRESKMPAVLTENMFIGLKNNADLMQKPEFIQAIVDGHVAGIAEYLSLPIKKEAVSEVKKDVSEININLNSKKVTQGLLVDGRTYVPATMLKHYLGHKIFWDNKNKILDIYKEENDV